jgi:3-oxoacyl-[acyl-carrier-protein] synthase-3
MRGPTVLRQATILGLGEHRASKLVTNDDLAQTLDTNDAWIQQRTGIASRRIAGEGESVIAMATESARKAVADSGIDPSAIGLVVLATCTMLQSIPGGAAQVAEGIGASQVGAYDVNAACAGFSYALSTAADAVRTGTVDYAVVAASERLSDVLDWTDRGSAILFGDGAGAVVIGPSEEAGIGPVVWGSDGNGHELISMTPANKLQIDGPAVFRWATTSMGAVALAACEAAGVEPSELAAVIPHQANLRIIAAVAKQLGATNAVVADDVITSGNTSAASVPLAMSQLRSDGKVSRGDLALTLAFGGGLTYAGAVIRIP